MHAADIGWSKGSVLSAASTGESSRTEPFVRDHDPVRQAHDGVDDRSDAAMARRAAHRSRSGFRAKKLRRGGHSGSPQKTALQLLCTRRCRSAAAVRGPTYTSDAQTSAFIRKHSLSFPKIRFHPKKFFFIPKNSFSYLSGLRALRSHLFPPTHH